MRLVMMATVESVAGSRLGEVGLQLALVGGVALLLGALRLYLADRSRVRLILLAGFALFAVGGTLRTLGELGAMTLNYYPGWKEDAHQVLEIDNAEFEYGDDDLASDGPAPGWWEGIAWWGQRIGLLLGAGLATAGLVLEGRGQLRPPARKSKRAPKKGARS